MGEKARQLDTDRAARNRARRRFESRLVRAREDLAPGAIAARLAGGFKRRARDTLDEAVEIADENRTVVAGTIAALAAWFLRKPVISWLDRKPETDRQAEEITDDEH
jgi:hypothetical protein